MMRKIFLWLLLLGWAGSNITLAQDKIAYLNMELVLSYMPETATMQKSLMAQQQKLAQQLQVKEEYGQSKVQEYMERREEGATEADLKPLEDEIRKLEQEIQKFAADSDQKMMIKRQEMLQPITDKLEVVIKKLAKEGGYDYILNSMDGSAVSIILHGPDTQDLTRRVMKELGIAIPESADNN